MGSGERVWAVLTEVEHIGSWFGDAGAEVDLRPGGGMVIRWAEYGAFHARIERMKPQRFFSYRWAHAPGEEPRDGNSTLVEFTLSPEGDGTWLRVVESGFPSLDLPEEQRAKHAEENAQGWIAELGELQEYAKRLAT